MNFSWKRGGSKEGSQPDTLKNAVPRLSRTKNLKKRMPENQRSRSIAFFRKSCFFF